MILNSFLVFSTLKLPCFGQLFRYCCQKRFRKLHDDENQSSLCQKLVFGPLIKTGYRVIEEQSEVFRYKELTYDEQTTTDAAYQAKSCYAYMG